MYFNDEKSNTSIDKELNENSISTKLKKYLKKIIIIALIVILLIILLIFLIRGRKDSVTFRLLGDKVVKLTIGSEYIEPGYIAIDKEGLDISSEVKVSDNINYEKEGTYKITYKLRNKKLQRTINIDKSPIGKSTITLIGDSVITLKQNEKYVEPGYTCTDSIDGDITAKVTVTDDINTSKIGAYKVIYTVTNSTNITTTVSRVVIVK